MLNKSICTNYRSRDNNSTASSMGKYSIGLFEAISKPQACIKFGFSSKFPFWSRNFPKTIPFLSRMDFRPRMKTMSHFFIFNFANLAIFLFYSCKKMYLYQSSLKKHFLMSHETEYKKYLAEKKSKQLEALSYINSQY